MEKCLSAKYMDIFTKTKKPLAGLPCASPIGLSTSKSMDYVHNTVKSVNWQWVSCSKWVGVLSSYLPTHKVSKMKVLYLSHISASYYLYDHKSSKKGPEAEKEIIKVVGEVSKDV